MSMTLSLPLPGQWSLSPMNGLTVGVRQRHLSVLLLLPREPAQLSPTGHTHDLTLTPNKQDIWGAPGNSKSTGAVPYPFVNDNVNDVNAHRLSVTNLKKYANTMALPLPLALALPLPLVMATHKV